MWKCEGAPKCRLASSRPRQQATTTAPITRVHGGGDGRGCAGGGWLAYMQSAGAEDDRARFRSTAAVDADDAVWVDHKPPAGSRLRCPGDVLLYCLQCCRAKQRCFQPLQTRCGRPLAIHPQLQYP